MSVSVPAAGVWPLIICVVAVALVTIVALCLAESEDVPRIFESFAAAFGLRRADDRAADPDPDLETSGEGKTP